MKLNRKNRLRQVHVIICVHERIGCFVGQIVAAKVTAADDDILRNRPASVGNIEENKEMLEKRCGGLTVKTVSVRLKNSVSIADRECERVRRLLKAHNLPHNHEGLNCFIEIFGSVFGNLAESFLHEFKLGFSFGRSRESLFLCHIGITVCKNRGAFKSDCKSLVAVALFALGFLYHILNAVFYRIAHIGDKVTRYLLKEEYNLFCVALGFAVNLSELFGIFRFGKFFSDLVNSLGGELPVRFDIVKNRSRVAVAAELLNLKSRINQRIASCKRIVLSSRKNLIIAQIKRNCLYYFFENESLFDFLVLSLIFFCKLQFGFFGNEPAVKAFARPLFGKKRLCHFGYSLAVKTIIHNNYTSLK